MSLNASLLLAFRNTGFDPPARFPTRLIPSRPASSSAVFLFPRPRSPRNQKHPEGKVRRRRSVLTNAVSDPSHSTSFYCSIFNSVEYNCACLVPSLTTIEFIVCVTACDSFLHGHLRKEKADIHFIHVVKFLQVCLMNYTRFFCCSVVFVMFVVHFQLGVLVSGTLYSLL